LKDQHRRRGRAHLPLGTMPSSSLRDSSPSVLEHRTDTVEPIWRALPCICLLHLRRCTSLTKHPSPAPPQIDHNPRRHHGPLFRRLPQLHAVDGHVLRESCTSDFGPLHCCCVSPQSGLLVAIYRQHKCSKPRLGRAEPPSGSDCVDLRSFPDRTGRKPSCLCK
jgi:hypothetical protein